MKTRLKFDPFPNILSDLVFSRFSETDMCEPSRTLLLHRVMTEVPSSSWKEYKPPHSIVWFEKTHEGVYMILKLVIFNNLSLQMFYKPQLSLSALEIYHIIFHLKLNTQNTRNNLQSIRCFFQIFVLFYFHARVIQACLKLYK